MFPQWTKFAHIDKKSHRIPMKVIWWLIFI